MRRFVNYPNIVSTLALVIALSGGAYAATLIGTSQLKDGAVTTPKLHLNAVYPSKIHLGAVTAPKIASHAVTNPKLATGAVDGRALRNGSVGAVDLSTALSSALSSAIADVTPHLVQTSNSTIQQIGPTPMTLATLTLAEPGTYLVTGSLRVFSRASNPGHNLFCDMSASGSGNISLVNDYVELSQVQNIPFTGVIQSFNPNEAVPLNCHQGSGSGEITATYDLFGVKVVPAG